jgi:hypothetical protein
MALDEVLSRYWVYQLIFIFNHFLLSANQIWKN